MKNKRKFLLVIPARLKSTRLPGKPLIDLKGLPMIIRTCIKCAKIVNKKDIIVATDSNKIKKVCNHYGFKSIITSKKCLTGTDRVYQIAKKTNFSHYINVQGDEPIFNPNDLSKLLRFKNIFKDEVLLGYTEIKKKIDIKNVNIPKVVFNNNKKLIYASRNPIPFSKTNNKKIKVKYYRQVLAYCYPRNKLINFGKLKRKGVLEKIEDIEILRFIEMGINVKMIKMSNLSISVDTKNDIKKVKKLIKNNPK